MEVAPTRARSRRGASIACDDDSDDDNDRRASAQRFALECVVANLIDAVARDCANEHRRLDKVGPSVDSLSLISPLL